MGLPQIAFDRRKKYLLRMRPESEFKKNRIKRRFKFCFFFHLNIILLIRLLQVMMKEIRRTEDKKF